MFLTVITALLIVISFIDLEHMFISDSLLLAGIAAGIVLSLMRSELQGSLVSVAAGFVFMFATSFLARLYFKKDALGEGDIKLIVMFGTFLSVEKVFLSILIGSVTGAAVAIVLLLLNRVTMEDRIPFAPLLSLGAFIAMFT